MTEAKIQASFDRLCEGRTSIIIAHRLSTIRNADRIAVVDREEIIEQGSHPSLMAQNGEYAALVRAQDKLHSRKIMLGYVTCWDTSCSLSVQKKDGRHE